MEPRFLPAGLQGDAWAFGQWVIEILLGVARVTNLFLCTGTFPELARKALRPGNLLGSTISKLEN